MDGEPNVGGPVAEGAPEPTKPGVSSEAKPSVAGAPDVAKLVEAIGPALAKIVDEKLAPVKGEISAIYSREDKDRNKFSEFLAEFHAQKSTGLTDAQATDAAVASLTKRATEAEREAKLEKAIDILLGQQAPVKTAGNGADEATDVAAILAEYGLSDSDPAVAPLLKYEGDTLRAKVADLAYKRTLQPKASASGASSMPAGGATGKPDLETLAKRYEAEVRPFRGNAEKVSEIQARYRKQGLMV